MSDEVTSEGTAKAELVFRISGTVTTEHELFSALAEALQFPFFGFNWDALNDCLSDLSWLPPGDVVIVHEYVPLLDRPEALALYLKVIQAINCPAENGRARGISIRFLCFPVPWY